MDLNITTSQTIGPFPHEAWRWGVDATGDVPADEPEGTGVEIVYGNVDDVVAPAAYA